MSSGTMNDLRASGVFSTEHGLSITTVPTTTLPYRLAPADAIKIPKGSSWEMTVTWYHEEGTPLDLSTGYTAAFVATDGTTAHLNLTQGAGITLAAAEPNILIARSAAQTTALSFVRCWAHLDVTLTASGRTWRLFEGFCDLVT